jgi:ATP-dependent Clp protease protease subunit
MNYKRLLLFINFNIIISEKFDIIEHLNFNNLNMLNLTEQVDELSASELLDNLFEQEQDFYLYIDSIGGDVESGMKIIKMMKFLQKDNIKIKCIANKAFSMAFHIFQRCDERLIVDYSILMQHNMFTYLSGNINDVEKLLNKYLKINTELIEYESIKLKLDIQEYKSYLDDELWLKGDDILKYNAADKKIKLVY